MFDEFVKQVSRLFSSKKNGGKQVANTTEQLHTFKQIVLASAIVFLIGYKQFREDFKCKGVGLLDDKTATHVCLINGTVTVVDKDDGHEIRIQSVPHTGLLPETLDTRTIYHLYVRDLWGLLLVLAILSYYACRSWANIFETSETLKAVLRLNGAQESRIVKAAEGAKPYEILSAMPNNLDGVIEEQVYKKNTDFPLESRFERTTRLIEAVDMHANIYDHRLDYYANQLIYLLLTRNTALYKLSCLKLSKKLLVHAIVSTLASCLQFILPLLFIGHEYSLYGWNYALVAGQYLYNFIARSYTSLLQPHDYELSSSIFPLTTKCEVKQYSIVGTIEESTVLCMIAINEICGKMFVLIWWLVAVSILVEIYSLLILFISSLSHGAPRRVFRWICWPNARKEADTIATFRHRRATLLNRRKLFMQLQASHRHRLDDKNTSVNKQLRANLTLNEPMLSAKNEKKRLEAELASSRSQFNGGALNDQSEPIAARSWSSWSANDVCQTLVNKGRQIVCCRAHKRHEKLVNETECDTNIYYLLYLIYLREKKSKSCIEEIINMTSRALKNYITDLENNWDNSSNTSDASKYDDADELATINANHIQHAELSAVCDDSVLTNSDKSATTSLPA